MEYPPTRRLAALCRLDHTPHARVDVETVDFVVENSVRRPTKHVEAASECDHGVPVAPLGRAGEPSEEVLRANPHPDPLFELELVEVVCDSGSALPREDVHAVADDRHGEVAAGRRAVSALWDLLPLGLIREDVHRPHVVESHVPVVPCKDPQLVLEYSRPVGRSGRGERPCNLVLPIDPLAGGELVLKEVVLVPQVRVGVDVARVAAEHEHTVPENDGGVVVPGRRGLTWERERVYTGVDAV